MEKPKKITVILYGVCAVIWILRVVFEEIEKEYHDSIFFFVINILCAVLWSGAYIKWFRLFRLNNKQK